MSKSNSSGSEVEGNLKLFIEEVKKYANYISILETFWVNKFKIPDAKVKKFNEYDLRNIYEKGIHLLRLRDTEQSSVDTSKIQNSDRSQLIFILAQNWLTHYYAEIYENQEIPYSQATLHRKVKGFKLRSIFDPAVEELCENLVILKRLSNSFEKKYDVRKSVADQTWQSFILITHWSRYQLPYKDTAFNKVRADPLFLDLMEKLCLETETMRTKKQSTSKQQQSTSSRQQTPSKQQQSTSKQQQSNYSKKKQIHISESEAKGK